MTNTRSDLRLVPPARCIVQGCDGYAGSRMFCTRCQEEMQGLAEMKAAKLKREVRRRIRWIRMWDRLEPLLYVAVPACVFVALLVMALQLFR